MVLKMASWVALHQVSIISGLSHRVVKQIAFELLCVFAVKISFSHSGCLLRRLAPLFTFLSVVPKVERYKRLRARTNLSLLESVLKVSTASLYGEEDKQEHEKVRTRLL